LLHLLQAAIEQQPVLLLRCSSVSVVAPPLIKSMAKPIISSRPHPMPLFSTWPSAASGVFMVL
jgi:hypothetical protein